MFGILLNGNYFEVVLYFYSDTRTWKYHIFTYFLSFFIFTINWMRWQRVCVCFCLFSIVATVDSAADNLYCDRSQVFICVCSSFTWCLVRVWIELPLHTHNVPFNAHVKMISPFEIDVVRSTCTRLTGFALDNDFWHLFSNWKPL